MSTTAEVSGQPPAGATTRGRIESAAVHHRYALAVAALTVLGLALRFSQIRQGLFGDEVWTYQDILGRSFGQVVTTVHTGGENSPPLFFVLAYATGKLGDLSVWIRLPSIVLGALTIPLVYLIGRETVGRVPGVLAGALLAVSPFSFFYGVEARPYATMAFFVALSTWALLRAVDGSGRRWWMLYVVGAVAAAYTHYTAVFVLVTQGLWSMWACRDRIRAPLISAAVATAAYLPWLPELRGKELAVIGALHPLTLHNVVADLMRPIAGDPNVPLSAIPTHLGLGLVITCALAGAVALVRGVTPARSPRDAGDERRAGGVWPRRFWLLAALAVVTPVGMLLYSLAVTDLWLPRGLYASVPAAALVLATLLWAIPRPWRFAAVAVVAGTLVFGTVRAASPTWRRPPTREAAAFLDREAKPGDPVAFESFLGAPAVAAQIHRHHRFVSPGQLATSTPPGGEAFVMIDDETAQNLKISPIFPAPAGLLLIGHRHFKSGVMAVDISILRRLRSPG